MSVMTVEQIFYPKVELRDGIGPQYRMVVGTADVLERNERVVVVREDNGRNLIVPEYYACWNREECEQIVERMNDPNER